MIGSNLARLALTSLLAGLVASGLIQPWMLYAFALLFGLADAFFFPAQTSIVPRLVGTDQLQAGNALIQGTATLSLFVGPVLAGRLISWLDHGPVRTSMGVALAFALDALSFLVSVATLSLMTKEQAQGANDENGEVGLLASIREGLLLFWTNVTLRTILLLVAGINVLITGPLLVGIPVLANLRFADGVAAFGLIMSAFGAGALLGILLAGVLPTPSPRWLGTTLLSVISLMGIGLVVIGLTRVSAVAALAALAMGIANGYNSILLTTWLQGRMSQAMLGRSMSLLMFAAIGLTPVSTALAGLLISMNASTLLVGAGGAMAICTLNAALSPSIRALGMEHDADETARVIA